MISFNEFKALCKRLLNKKIVTADDYLEALDSYLEILCQFEEIIELSRRYFLLVESKHLRTCFAALPSSQPQKRLCAFKSHARHERNSSPKAGLNHLRQGRRISSATGQYIRRYLSALVPDMFKPVPAEGSGFCSSKPASQGGCQAERGQHVSDYVQAR